MRCYLFAFCTQGDSEEERACHRILVGVWKAFLDLFQGVIIQELHK